MCRRHSIERDYACEGWVQEIADKPLYSFQTKKSGTEYLSDPRDKVSAIKGWIRDVVLAPGCFAVDTAVQRGRLPMPVEHKGPPPLFVNGLIKVARLVHHSLYGQSVVAVA